MQNSGGILEERERLGTTKTLYAPLLSQLEGVSPGSLLAPSLGRGFPNGSLELQRLFDDFPTASSVVRPEGTVYGRQWLCLGEATAFQIHFEDSLGTMRDRKEPSSLSETLSFHR